MINNFNSYQDIEENLNNELEIHNAKINKAYLDYINIREIGYLALINESGDEYYEEDLKLHSLLIAKENIENKLIINDCTMNIYTSFIELHHLTTEINTEIEIGEESFLSVIKDILKKIYDFIIKMLKKLRVSIP